MQININDPKDDNDVSLYTFMSSFARIFKEMFKKKEYEKACMFLEMMIDYSVSISNGENCDPQFTDSSLLYPWLAIRPNIKNSAVSYASGRKGSEAKKDKAKENKYTLNKGTSDTLNKGTSDTLDKQIEIETEEEDEIVEEIETETESATFTAPVSGDSSVTIPELIDFYLDMGLQSKFLQSSDDGNEFELSEFAVKNIDLYTSKKRLIRDNFEDYKKYAVSCYNKAKEAAGLKGG